MTDLVSWVGVSKSFAGKPAIVALRPTGFVVRPGESHAIVGRSGSGKSTMLNLLGLLDTPTSGEYCFAGQRVDKMSDAQRSDLRRDAISYIFQSFYLIDGRSVADNVALPLLYRGVSLDERRAMAAAAIEQVGLNHRIDADVTTLSGGERQRVAVARAMVGRPRLLLCDEPTGNLDGINGAQILDLIYETKHDGTAVVVVTHDLAAAARAEQRWVIEDGGLLAGRESTWG